MGCFESYSKEVIYVDSFEAPAIFSPGLFLFDGTDFCIILVLEGFMIKNILVVAKNKDVALKLLDVLKIDEMVILFADKLSQAKAQLSEKKFDLIFLDDKLDHNNDTYDVGLEIRFSQKNKNTPVICIGSHSARTSVLVGLLKPHSIKADTSNISIFTEQIKAWITNIEKTR